MEPGPVRLSTNNAHCVFQQIVNFTRPVAFCLRTIKRHRGQETGELAERARHIIDVLD